MSLLIAAVLAIALYFGVQDEIPGLDLDPTPTAEIDFN